MSISRLDMGPTRPAVVYRHFPTLFQAVIFRNWGMVPLERLAAVLQTTVEEVVRLGAALGLEPDDSQCSLWLTRGYLTIIRQNWHLLSYEQLLTVLDWTPERLAFILKEDDFLWHKLGKLKPEVTCPPARKLTAEEEQATEELGAYYRRLLSRLPERAERPFDFLHTLQGGGAPDNAAPGLRMLYSYSALYGDPLLDETLDPFPDNMLDAYAAAGVNALWLQAVLYTLIPWMDDSPETAALSVGCERRLANLRRLAQRMQARGIRLMLYLNEPRALPGAFFAKHPEWRGRAGDGEDMYSLCTSVPEVLERLKNGVYKLFSEVPELGGFFCITRSENQTNCWSHGTLAKPPACPRCAARNPADVIAEVIGAMAEGAFSAKPDAEVIAWSWGWDTAWDEQLLDRFPKGVKLQCVSETQLETNVGGVIGHVSDYSISKPGPGPVAKRLWKLARDRHIPVVAKVQMNCTWENSAVPYLPVPGLVEEHINNLRAEGVADFMMSWTLGGYPGGNIRLLTRSRQELATEDFGEAAPLVLRAYDLFDESFRHFPLNGTSTLYLAPQNYGPMSILFEEPTGYHGTMIGFPYDDVKGWCGGYPEDVFEEEFRILSDGWGRGCAVLREAESAIDEAHYAAWRDLSRVAEAAFCHFRSTYLQICFVRRRNAGDRAGMLAAVREETMMARRMLALIREDSRLGFEASNHYYYTQNALVEKLFNCQRLSRLLEA